MTSSRLSLLFVVLSGLLLAGCPTDGNRATFDYLRSPITFRVDPVADDHPFCFDVAKNPFPTEQECRATRKYRIRWERPEDTVGFEEYRIFVDTTPPNASGTWSDVRKTSAYASFVMKGLPSTADSIIFYLTSSSQPLGREIDRANPALLAVDTTGRLDSSGRLVFAIATSYNGGGIEGQPRYTHVITNDRFAPYLLQPSYVPQARAIGVAWSRPRDPTSFFDPKADSGVIAGYVLRVRRVNTRKDVPFTPTVSYRVGGVDRTSQTSFTNYTLGVAPGRRFWLPDSQRIVNRAADDARDSIYVTVGGFTPLDTLDVSVWAVDMEGNARPDTGQAIRVLLTDTTQPSMPRLQLIEGSVTRNRFAYTFTASRDSVEGPNGLTEAATPNANILEYRITRRRIGGSAGEHVLDSVLQLSASNRGNAVFTDTARYLPPNSTYVVYVQAVDSSGHLSRRDSLVVSTSSSAFSGADSGATCPPGFVAMPQGSFYLGETDANAPSPDEGITVNGIGGGRGLRTIGSFCIEAREHTANASTFRNRVTWQQAHDICRDLSSSSGFNSGDSTWLCTEAEWERSCEGTESTALLYGVQSERADPAGLRYTCNIGTGDSAMAMTAALRDPSCISYDGAFDLSGNLAEWVLDPYTPDGYPGEAGDTLVPGRPLTALTSTSRRGFRGNHYLNPGSTPATLLRAARCSNRDYAAQVRPKPWPGCMDASRAQIAVLYTDATKLPRCFPLPDSLASLSITSLAPGRDTNQILILVQGRTNPISYMIPKDTNYRGQKPVSALLTTRTLAVVTFDNSETGQAIVDTLDASELLGRTEAQRAAVLSRDAAPPWSPRKSGGNIQIQFLYAYTRSQGVTARAYYSNKALGFRCCSKPRRP